MKVQFIAAITLLQNMKRACANYRFNVIERSVVTNSVVNSNSVTFTLDLVDTSVGSAYAKFCTDSLTYLKTQLQAYPTTTPILTVLSRLILSIDSDLAVMDANISKMDLPGFNATAFSKISDWCSVMNALPDNIPNPVTDILIRFSDTNLSTFYKIKLLLQYFLNNEASDVNIQTLVENYNALCNPLTGLNGTGTIYDYIYVFNPSLTTPIRTSVINYMESVYDKTNVDLEIYIPLEEPTGES